MSVAQVSPDVRYVVRHVRRLSNSGRYLTSQTAHPTFEAAHDHAQWLYTSAPLLHALSTVHQVGLAPDHSVGESYLFFTIGHLGLEHAMPPMESEYL